jgi:hypothetical protein
METIEEQTARWNRVAVAEVIGVLELLTERAPLEKQTPELSNSIDGLYELVGVTNSHELIERGEAILAQVLPQDLSTVHPYGPHLFRTAIELLQGADEAEDYVESYTNGLILDLSAHRMTAQEVELAKSNIVAQEEFSEELIALYRAASAEQRKIIKESIGLGPEELELSLATGEITMSQLRLVNNVLKVMSRISITNAVTGETSSF